jgi:hypothetical protein
MTIIELKYNIKKIVFYSLVSVGMICFSLYLYFNSFKLSQRTPGTGKYSWVGRMMYKDDLTISIVSLAMVLMFFCLLVYLSSLLFRRKFIITNELGFLYINQDKIDCISNIKSVSSTDDNYNKLINIHLREKRDKWIAKFLPKSIRKYFRKNKHVMNITLVKTAPLELCNNLRAMIQKSTANIG